MTPLYFNLFLAGYLMLLTPGPIFVANLSLISREGRLKGFQLMSGALIGDMLWLALTFLSLIESDLLPPILFKGLAVVCGLYIMHLGYKVYKAANLKNEARIFKKPFVDGLLLGILHPKSYPAFLAIFSALIFKHIDSLTWADFPAMFLFGTLGFIASYGTTLFFAGFKPVKDFYNNNFKYLSYFFAFIFIYFGVSLIIGIL